MDPYSTSATTGRSRTSLPRNSRRQWPVAVTVLASVALAIAAAVWALSRPRGGAELRKPPQRLRQTLDGAASESTPSADQQHSHIADIALIEDDGQTLWVSPTTGSPLNLAYLPHGVQMVIALRPDALASHPEGGKVLDSLGPLGRRAIQRWQQLLLVPQGVKQVVVGLAPNGNGGWHATLVAHLSGDASADEHLAAKLPDAAVMSHHGMSYRLAADWAYYIPLGTDQHFVIASDESIAEIIDLGGQPPPLRRDVASLLAHTDADRHVTIVVAPNSLFSEGRVIFGGPMAGLREPLFWFLGDELSAAAMSLHWGDNLFVELVATPTLDTSPERAARLLAERVAQIPDRVEENVVSLNPHPYGRRIVARFPAMVRKLAAYTRSAFDDRHAVLRCYLPVIAGHNLLMGAELTLAETGKDAVDDRAPANRSLSPEAGSPSVSMQSINVREKLRRVTSLVSDRDTLEAALEQLSQAIGVEIVVLGADLQAEGITKNQSFGIDLVNQPAETILVEILHRANPNKSVNEPSDERQKLVYVIASPSGGKSEQILITTRARAVERGDELPAVFRRNSR
jgi:hypothetical protein